MQNYCFATEEPFLHTSIVHMETGTYLKKQEPDALHFARLADLDKKDARLETLGMVLKHRGISSAAPTERDTICTALM